MTSLFSHFQILHRIFSFIFLPNFFFTPCFKILFTFWHTYFLLLAGLYLKATMMLLVKFLMGKEAKVDARETKLHSKSPNYWTFFMKVN